MELGDVCSIRSGLTLRTRIADVRNGTLTVQQGDLSPRGEFDRAGAIRIAAPPSSLHLVRPGELVIRSRGPYWSAWAPAEIDEPVIAIAPLFILTPTPDIDAEYLVWLLGRPAAQQYFATESMGTGVKMVPRKVLERLPVQLPPLDRQRAIAAAAALDIRERELSNQLTELRHKLNSARLDQSARHAAAASDTDRTTR